jgi:hypothetical protein
MLVLVARLQHHITLQLCSSFWKTGRLLSIFTHRTRPTTPPPALFSSPILRFALKYQKFQLITEIKGAVTRALISITKETCPAGVKNCVNMQINA